VLTDESGSASFSYSGSAAGVDHVRAMLADGSEAPPQAEVMAFWDADCNENQVPDTCDISCEGFDGACSSFEGCGASVDENGNGEPDECYVAPPPPPPTNAAPDCSAASVSPDKLRRPDRRYRDVVIGGVTDPDGDAVSVSVDSVFQDEPVFTRRLSSTSPDASGLGSDHVKLRAERRDRGDGRIYHVNFSADDGNGGVCEGSVVVCVPQDKWTYHRGRWHYSEVCGDQGALYDSTEERGKPKPKWHPRWGWGRGHH
jgi:hypothetical protein